MNSKTTNKKALRSTIARAKRQSYQKIVMRVSLVEELLDQLEEAERRSAILDEVRASVITDALKSLDGVFDTDCVMESNGISYEDAEQRTVGAYAVSKALEEFAAQLRKGVQS